MLEKAGVTAADPAEDGPDPRVGLERRLGQLVFDADRAYGLRRTLRDLGRTASLTRDRLSADSWRILRSLQPDEFKQRPSLAMPMRRARIATILGPLDQGIQRLAAFSGMGMENMTRSFGWRFLEMGRRIERSVQTVELLGSLLDAGDPEDDGSLILVLDIADSFMTYRSRYLLTPQLAPVLDLLLLDESNPRSVAFQVAALARHLERLPRASGEPRTSREQHLVEDILADLRVADLNGYCRRNRAGERPELRALFDAVGTDLSLLTTSITRTYFSHVDGVRGVLTLGAAPG